MTSLPPLGDRRGESLDAAEDLVIAPALPDPLAQYCRWAVVLFTILALVGIVASVIVLGNVRVAPPVFAVLVAGVVVSVATFLLLAMGIADRRAWAVHAIAPVCYVVVLFGAIRAAVSLAQGEIQIPLEAFAALLVLSRPHVQAFLPLLSGRDRRIIIGIVIALVLSTVVPAVASSRGFDKIIGGGPDALRLAVTIDCSEAAAEAGAAIPIRVDWSWRTRPSFGGTEDGLVVRWELSSDQVDEDGDPIGGVMLGDQWVSAPDAMWAGGASLSSTLIQPIAAAGPSWTFLIDVPNHGSFDGWVEVPVGLASTQAGHGSLDAWAAYANGDRWLKESDVASCAW